MPLANCSLLDESTAAAEAATMMHGLRTRDQQKSGANVLFVDEEIFPQNLAVIQTRALPQGMKIQVGNYKELVFTPEIFACILQYPNASGNVEDYREFVEKAHAAHCKVAVDADIMSLYGKPQFIYSWKLVPTDKTPAGKRDDISLREKEAQIKKDLSSTYDRICVEKCRVNACLFISLFALA